MTKKQILDSIRTQIKYYKHKAELAIQVTTSQEAKQSVEAIIVLTKKLLDYIDTIELLDAVNPEIDFEQELNDFVAMDVDDDDSADDAILKIAKYFYSLGVEHIKK